MLGLVYIELRAGRRERFGVRLLSVATVVRGVEVILGVFRL